MVATIKVPGSVDSIVCDWYIHTCIASKKVKELQEQRMCKYKPEQDSTF